MMENSEKITNNLLILEFYADFEIIYQGMRENIILYLRILKINRESAATSDRSASLLLPLIPLM